MCLLVGGIRQTGVAEGSPVRTLSQRQLTYDAVGMTLAGGTVSVPVWISRV